MLAIMHTQRTILPKPFSFIRKLIKNSQKLFYIFAVLELNPNRKRNF